MVECHQIHEAFELQISEINTNTANKYSKYLKLMAYEIHKANNIHSLNTYVWIICSCLTPYYIPFDHALIMLSFHRWAYRLNDHTE